MGLDMYLKSEVYIPAKDYSKYTSKTNPLHAKILKILGASEYASKEEGIHVEVPIGYWRKANAIHAWFIRDQEEDNCKPVCVSRNELRLLRIICKKLLKKKDVEKAEEFLPPQAGFFFGSTGIDEYYWSDLEDTVKILDRALKSPCEDFIYQASW